jgi:hypothetical protein
MRFSTALSAAAVAACMTLSSAYADGNPPAGRGNKPTSAGKPTTTSGKPSTDSGNATGSTSTTSPAASSGSTTPLNPIASKIMSKPALNQKISAMLPSKMSLNDASMGFKNQGQFIAALHVSQNLGIPFKDLKNAMMTKTGTGATAELTQTGSLGQAIQKIKKNTDATTEVQKAETQANADVSSTSTTTSPTTPPKNKKKTTTTGGNQ